MCLKYFVDAGAMAVRRVVKKDLKRIAKASGGMYVSKIDLFLSDISENFHCAISNYFSAYGFLTCKAFKGEDEYS